MRTAYTLDQMMESLAEQLEREKREKPELFEQHRKALYDGFMKMIEEPVELPELPPGKTRIISF